MGAFQYDGFLIKMLVKVGNMMILSFFWLLTCIPIITIIPATSALFHTTTKVVRENGTGVLRDYFSHMRNSLKQGIPLSIICIIIGLLLYTALDFGSQVWRNGAFWTAYYAFGFLLAFIFVTMLLFVPPTLSRFECSATMTLRLSLYLASRNLLRSVWYIILLGFMVFLVDFYPLLLLIIPGLYADLICGGIEKTLASYIKNSGLGTDEQDPDKHTECNLDTESQELSSLDLAKLMYEPEDDSLDTGDDNE